MFRYCCCRVTVSSGAASLLMLLSLFLPCCLPSSFSNWCSWGAVSLLKAPSGAGKAEPRVITFSGANRPKAQMFAPPGGVGGGHGSVCLTFRVVAWWLRSLALLGKSVTLTSSGVPGGLQLGAPLMTIFNKPLKVPLKLHLFIYLSMCECMHECMCACVCGSEDDL